MTGNFGFSYVGLIFLLMLFIPNLVWAKNQPEGYTALSKTENKALLLLERIGQVLVTTCALIFSDFNLKPVSPWSLWLLGSFILMVMYEIAWVRYFRKPTLETFYASMYGVPVPLASLPVTAFLLLGIYGKNIWLILSVLILGIGHIGIHLAHHNTIQKSKAGN